MVTRLLICSILKSNLLYITFTCIHLADAFIQSDLQMMTMEAIKNVHLHLKL